MKPWLFNRDLYSRVWNNPYINGYDFIPFTTNPARFLIPAQWPPSNQNHQHIFHRFETCTCSWTKSSQQQWHPPRRPYWVINYHDPLGRPYFLQRWHWAGGPLKFPMTHSHGKPQLGRRSALLPETSGNAHQSGLSHSTAPVLHRYLGTKPSNKLWNQTCFGLVWFTSIYVCLFACCSFFFEKTFDTTLHAKKMAGFVSQPRIKARNAQNVEAGVLNNTRQNTLTCTKYIFKYSPLPACLYEYKENATSKIWPMSQNSRPNNNTPSKWQCAYIFRYIYIYTWYLIYIFVKTHSNCWRLGCWQKPQSFPTFNPVTAFESGLHPCVLKRCLGETCDPGFKPMGPKPVGIHPLTRKHVRKRSRANICEFLGKILIFRFTERPWSILKQIVPTLCVREDLNLSKCLFFRSFTGTHFRLPLPPHWIGVPTDLLTFSVAGSSKFQRYSPNAWKFEKVLTYYG